MKIELDQYTELKTLELQNWQQSLASMPGWDIITTFVRTDMENVSCYDDQGRYVSRTMPIQKAFVLVGHRGNLAEKLQAERDAERSARSTAQNTVRGLEADLKKVTHEKASIIAELEYALKNAREERNLAIKQELEAKRLFRLLEGDVAKVKAAIGEIQFNKIVGER